MTEADKCVLEFSEIADRERMTKEGRRCTIKYELYQQLKDKFGPNWSGYLYGLKVECLPKGFDMTAEREKALERQIETLENTNRTLNLFIQRFERENKELREKQSKNDQEMACLDKIIERLDQTIQRAKDARP